MFYLIVMVFDINKKLPLNMGEYDLRRQDIKLKSEAGEVIAKHRIPYLHLRREHKKDYLDQEFPFGCIPERAKSFLKDNWFSIDAFRFRSENYRFSNLELFEIKLKSYYPNLRREAYMIDMTKKELGLYKGAIKEGFDVFVVVIWLYDDWRYDVSIKDLNSVDIKIGDGSERFLKGLRKGYGSSNP